MNVAILGYGSQGKSAAEHWAGLGYSVTVCDQNADLDLPDGMSLQAGDDYLSGLDKFEVIVRSPSIHPSSIVAANSETILNKVTTNTNEFIQICPTRNIIGVTGTKGKGTTSTLITNMLAEAGFRVHLGGNIGTPPLELLKNDIKEDDWVVLELANFQLIDLKQSPAIAVCLMVEPEHQDWHGSIDEYVEAKQQLFRWQTESDIAVYFSANELSQRVAGISRGIRLPYFDEPGALVKGDGIWINETEICKVSEIGLLGDHNWQNVCAATTAVWQVTQDQPAIYRAITSTTGLPFRIELRKTINNISFYNDSFATAPGATIAAINAVSQPKVLIVGGHDRGLPLDELVSTIKNSTSIRSVVVIGASGDRLIENFESQGFTNFVKSDAKTMSEIVAAACTQAQSGDAVLLSPSFASFDMFKNFEARGIAFNEAVEALNG